MEIILSIVVISMRIFTAIFNKADYIFLYLHTIGEWKLCILHCHGGMKAFMTHEQMPDNVVPWWGSTSQFHSTNQPWHCGCFACKSQPLLPVGQGQNIQCLASPMLSGRTPPPKCTHTKCTHTWMVFSCGVYHLFYHTTLTHWSKRRPFFRATSH